QPPDSVTPAKVWAAISADRLTFIAITGSAVLACLLYCFLAPPLYEATASVVLRGTPLSELSIERDQNASGSLASGQVQLETLANVFRSDELAWEVITSLRLFQAPGMTGSFQRRFPDFNPANPSPEARAYLLDEFEHDLTVRSIPHTLV